MDRAAIIYLIRQLHKVGSWCCEAHIQKAVFFLQSIVGYDTDYEFVLYKHGPYSFGLHEDLNYLSIMGLVYKDISNPQYGPTVFVKNGVPGPSDDAVPAWKEKVDHVVKFVGDKGVAELERLSTAIFLLNKDSRTNEDLARKMYSLKPHIPEDDALDTLKHARSLLS